MSIQIVMPRAGLTMIEGTISQWKAAESSLVKKGDVIMEYENEKSVIEYEALDNGILHIIAQEGDTVPVGGLIGELAETQTEYDAMVRGNAPTAETAAPAAPSAPAASAAVVEIPMPRAGLTMVEGTIAEWKVPEGAQVKKGDVVMEFENEKNSIEYEIVHGGYLHIVAPAGESVKVGDPIAYVAETKADYDALMSGGASAAAGSGGAADAPAAPAAPVAPAPAAAPAPAPAAPAAPAAPVAAAAGTKVESPMPGTIVDIKAPVGTAVKEGDVVLILEAMKMENEITAPCSGTIAQVAVEKGQQVNSGDLLLVVS